MINSVRKLFVFISGLFSYLFLAFPAFGITPTPVSVNPCDKAKDATTGIAKILCDLGQENIAKTIQGMVVFFIILAVVIALIYLLYGGIRWITSRGEKTEVESARNHIIAALLGLIVVILAVFMLSVILAAFGIQFGELKIPVIGQNN